jgi:hypothetical protein
VCLLLVHCPSAGGGTIGNDFVAPLKAVHIDRSGALRLTYWSGNDALLGSERVGTDVALRSGDAAADAAYTAAASTKNLSGTQGFVAKGTVALSSGSSSLLIVACGESAASAGSQIIVDGPLLLLLLLLLVVVVLRWWWCWWW